MNVFVGLATAMFFLLTSWFSIANATSVMSEQEAAKTLKVQYTADNHEVISGKIINESRHVIKDPELLVEYHWQWAKEFHPGQSSPGRAAYVKVNKEIQPDESVDFTYRPEPSLPNRHDGRFVPEVSPAGFLIVQPMQRTSSR